MNIFRRKATSVKLLKETSNEMSVTFGNTLLPRLSRLNGLSLVKWLSVHLQTVGLSPVAYLKLLVISMRLSLYLQTER